MRLVRLGTIAWFTSRSCVPIASGRTISATKPIHNSSLPCCRKKPAAGAPLVMSTMLPMKPNSDTSTIATTKPTAIATANTGHTWRR